MLTQTQEKTKAAGRLAYENSVVSGLLRSVGYTLERNAKPVAQTIKGAGHSAKNELNIKITSAYGYYSTFILKSVTMNTSSRPRISVCLFDCGSNKHVLLVKGEEEHILPSLDLHLNQFPKERALYKQLMGIYRKRGLKRIVLAARYMTESEAKAYVKAVEKASKTKRGDQQEELEKIGKAYEKNLYFLGVIGLTDELRDDAAAVVDLISRAKPNMIMLSGDSLDSCLTVSKKVNFCPGVDFEESHGYYKLSGTTEEKILTQFRRILEEIGEMLKQHQIHEKVALHLDESMGTSKSKDSENVRPADDLKSSGLGTRLERTRSLLTGRLGDGELPRQLFSYLLNPYCFSGNGNTCIQLKTLLISGSTFEAIRTARNTELLTYLNIVLLFCNRVIGYSMSAPNKSKFVQEIHKCFPFTVAVGDGFNDIGMLNTSSTGVQIETKSVPIIIANGVAKSLSDFARYLVLNSYSNIRSGIYAANLAVWNFSLLGMIGAIRQSLGYSHGIPDSQQANILVACLSMDILLLYLLNPHPSVKLLELDPSISSEVANIYRNALRYFVQMMMLSVLEGIIIAVYVDMYIGNTCDSQGRMIQQELISLVTMFITFVVCKLRTLIMHTKLSKAVVAASLFTPIMFCLLVYRWISEVNSSSANFPESLNLQDLKLTAMISALLLIIIAVFYTDMIWTLGFKYRLLYKHISKWTAPNLKQWTHMQQLGVTPFPGASSLHSPAKAFSHRQRGQFSIVAHKKHLGPESVSNPGAILSASGSSASIRNEYILQTENYQGRLSKLNLILSNLNRASTKSLLSMSRTLGFQLTKLYQQSDLTSKWLQKLKIKKTLIQSRKVLLISLVLFVMEYAVILAIYGTYNLQLSSGLPFLIITTLPLLLSSYLKSKPQLFQLLLVLTFWIWVGGLLALQIFSPANSVRGMWATLVRLPQSQLPINSKLAGTLGFLFFLLSTVSLFIYPAIFETSDMFFLVGACTCICLCWALTSSLKHNCELQADMGYLEKASLQRQIAGSKEMLAMLIPWFILDKFENLQLTVNYMADDVGEVSILFCDICNFDDIIRHCQDKIVSLLDEIFRQFDHICKQHGVQKIETVGKTYMACAGLKIVDKKKTDLGGPANSNSAISRVVAVALEMKKYIQEFVHSGDYNLQIKIGIHHGTCIFGVLGYHKPQFSLIGDTINTTSRHCTTGQPGQIVLSESAWRELSGVQGLETAHQIQYVEMKGKGYVSTFIISGGEDASEPEPKPRTGSKNLSGFSRRHRQTKTVGNLHRTKVD